MGAEQAMEPVNAASLMRLVELLGERIDKPLRLYLLGGSAMLLLGSPRATTDIDYDLAVDGLDPTTVRQTLTELADRLHLDLEFVPLAEFVPLPTGFAQRHRFVRRLGTVELWIFDLYSRALSKIARGFETDLEDVLFLVRQDLVAMSELRSMFEAILPRSWAADIDPAEFRQYFQEFERMWVRQA